MYGTCMSHADVHAFSDECVGWTDRPTQVAEGNGPTWTVEDVDTATDAAVRAELRRRVQQEV